MLQPNGTPKKGEGLLQSRYKFAVHSSLFAALRAWMVFTVFCELRTSRLEYHLLNAQESVKRNLIFSEKVALISRRQDLEVFVRLPGGHASPRGAVEKADLNQIRLVDVLDRVFILTDSG